MKSALFQHQLPLLEADGETHRRDCDCARCDAGFRPSEAQRRDARRRWDERAELKAAEAALEKKRERDRGKAARMKLALEESRHATDEFLRQQAALQARLAEDEPLDAFFALRRAGKPMAEALAEASRRFSARPARR